MDRARVTGFAAGFAIAVGSALVVLAGWLALTGLQARSAASDLQAGVTTAQAAAAAGRLTEAAEQFPAIAADAAEVNAVMNAAPWSWVRGVPGVGDSVVAVSALAAATDEALAPLSGGAFVRSAAATLGGGAPISRTLADLDQLTPGLRAAARGARTNRAAVAAIDPATVVGPLRPTVADARQRYLQLADGLTAAVGAADALPTVLGADGPRRWLVLLQNPAEARGSGGFLGAYSFATVRDGRLRPGTRDTNNSLDTGERVSLAGIPADTRNLWGTDLTYMWGLNLDRHFPFTGLLAQRAMPPGSPAVDDVVALDPFAVAALLDVTGPVTAAGVTIASTDAVDFFTRDVYTRFPDSAKKDAVVIALLDEVLARVADQELDLTALWRTLGPVSGDGHIQMFSNDRAVQRGLEAMPTSGVVPDRPGSWATIAINDVAGSKMSSYLDTEVVYEASSLCPAPGAQSRITLTVRNVAPPGLTGYGSGRVDEVGGPAGSTKIDTAVYGPLGALLHQATVDGSAGAARVAASRQHPVWQRTLDLARGQTRTFTVTFTEPWRPQDPVVFAPQPMANPTQVTVRRPAGC